MRDNASTPIQGEPLSDKIDRLTELVANRVSALDQRVQQLEGDNAEIRGLLRAIVVGIERMHAQMPFFAYGDGGYDGEDTDDGFLSPPPGQFLH
jgi:hypothetical protein